MPNTPNPVKKTLATQPWVVNYINALLTKPRSGVLFVDKADNTVYEVYVYDSSVHSIKRDNISGEKLLEQMLGQFPIPAKFLPLVEETEDLLEGEPDA